VHSVRVVAVLLFSTFTAFSKAQTLPAEMDPVSVCESKLASPDLVTRLPYLESTEFRLRVCRCALHPPNRIDNQSRRSSSPQQNATADAGTVLLCAGGILMKLGPQPPSAQLLSDTLASAIDDRGGSLVFAPPTIQFGGRGCKRPEYPEASRLSNAEGESTVSFFVNSIGNATDVVIVRSAGSTAAHKLLDFNVALSGLQCKFEPGKLNGERVSAWTTIQFVWKLN
jgi:TonB family protein